MRIITFGSSLARITGNFISRVYGGQVISSVYHNRSDMFLGRFVDRSWKEISVEEMTMTLLRLGDGANPREENRAMVLRDQCKPWVGLHRLPDGISLFEALKSEPDLIIVDNENDLHALLPETTDESEPKKVPTFRSLRTKMTLEVALKCQKRLLQHFRQQAPKATLVFINHPLGLLNPPAQKDGAKKFEAQFTFPEGLVIPITEAPADSEDPSSRSQPYRTYVQLIAKQMRREGKIALLTPVRKKDPAADAAPDETESGEN